MTGYFFNMHSMHPGNHRINILIRAHSGEIVRMQQLNLQYGIIMKQAFTRDYGNNMLKTKVYASLSAKYNASLITHPSTNFISRFLSGESPEYGFKATFSEDVQMYRSHRSMMPRHIILRSVGGLNISSNNIRRPFSITPESGSTKFFRT